MRLRVPVLVASWLAATLIAAPAAGATRDRAEQLSRLRAAAEVQRRSAPVLMATRGVVASGTSLGADGEPEIRVFTAAPGVRGLPTEIEGVRVRARVSGRFYARLGPTCEVDGDGVCDTFERWPRPVPIGVSIGHPAITAGTIAARVIDGGQVFALSNNHVLANSNGALIGDAALQPGPFDGGSEALGDELGMLHDFEPIAFCQVIFFPIVSCPVVNSFDAALAATTPADLGFATPAGEFGSAPGYGVPNPQLHPAYGDPAVIGDETLSDLLQTNVRKHGRTTGDTVGTVGTIGMTVDVCYDSLCNLVARFVEQIAVPHTAGLFSDAGDSGSLVVSDDGFHHPVGLLFAGSETDTIVSRIDLVLDRFDVTIDDGGSSGPFADAAVQSLDAPPWVLGGQATTVPVTVRNVGNQPLLSFDVLLDDETEATSTTRAAPALAPGEQAQLDFTWTPAAFGPHTLSATLQLGDDDPSNDQIVAEIDVLLEPPGVSLSRWTGTARTDAWTQVDLPHDYGADMVPICTPLYDVNDLGPLVARVRYAQGVSFEVGLGRPWFGAFPGEETSAEVHCMVVRQGVYDQEGFKLEAVRLDGFSGKDDAFSWVGTARSYAQSYTQPVVLGQVVSAGAGLPGDLGVWSTFWARGPTSLDPPSATALFVGRHTAEEPNPRPPETLVYVVIEAGSGRIEEFAYEAGLGAETVRGVDDAPPYLYPLNSFLATATSALASPAGMDGLEGGWPILYGAGAVAHDALGLAIEEDWYWDSERSHTTEQVAYLVLAPTTACNDGLDNDGDGFTDFIGDDPGCAGHEDLSENDPTLPCDDGADNDGDGRIDFDPVTFANPGDHLTPPSGSGDPACFDPSAILENGQCQDGIDNDAGQDTQGLIDYDGGQSIWGQCSGEPGGCPANVSDPDGDGVADPDPQCVKPWTPQEVVPPSSPITCGLGTELALLVPALMWTWRRRALGRRSSRLLIVPRLVPKVE